MAKPEVNCIIHTHTYAGMAVSTLECGLLPNTQTSMRFAKISYHDYTGVVLDTAEREALAKSLGDNNALILRSHGLLTTGPRSRGVHAMHRLELSCKTQIAAMSCNTQMVRVPEKVVEDTYTMYQPKTRRPMGLLDWPALLRKLDRSIRASATSLDTPHSSVRAFAAVASGYWTAPGYRFVAWMLTGGMVVLGVVNVGNRALAQPLESRFLQRARQRKTPLS